MAAATFSAKELAQECGTDARTVRKFLRDHLPKDVQPGQGGRYTFSKAEVTTLKKAFAKWASPKAVEPEKPKAKSTKKTKVEEPEELEEVSLEDLPGPTDEDIEEDPDSEEEDEEDKDKDEEE